jgi:hypothetical protein
MPSAVGKAAMISPFARISVIIPREPFAMPFYASIVFIRNMTLAPTLQITTGGKFVPLLNILEREEVVNRSSFS